MTFLPFPPPLPPPTPCCSSKETTFDVDLSGLLLMLLDQCGKESKAHGGGGGGGGEKEGGKREEAEIKHNGMEERSQEKDHRILKSAAPGATKRKEKGPTL